MASGFSTSEICINKYIYIYIYTHYVSIHLLILLMMIILSVITILTGTVICYDYIHS